MKVLKAENISISFDNKKIIEDVSLCLNEGEIVSLLGVSGSGKTTLFNIMSGLAEPDDGKVFFEDEDITAKAGKISYMLQKDLLLPHYTVLDNAALPLILKGISKKDARQKAKEYFEAFSLSGTENKYPHQLSGGMRQRVAFLRTYLNSSNGVMLLDEPFSALDTITKSSLHKWYLQIMKSMKLSAFIVTHDIDEAILLSDRIYILGGSPGKIVKEIKVTLSENRTSKDAMGEEFLTIKKEIVENLITDL